MAKSYDHKEIDRKWQTRWREDGTYRTEEDASKKKAYVLDMFPYPSGEGLHVGHPKGYIATDVYSRYQRMHGKSVLHPMGWDAFGLPAENFALKNKVHPRVAVEKNIAYFKQQLEKIGFDYDWSREVNTTDPEFYKWTQWIFLKLYEKGLAFRSEEPINWCPSCMTGLANEDIEQGVCERCETPIEKKTLPQWVLKITDYADRLLEDLEQLPKWPEHIKESQRNWIGRSEGLIFSSPVKDTDIVIETFSAHFEAFRADTFVVIAPDHKLLPKLVEGLPNASEILEKSAEMAAARANEKYGVVKEPEGIFSGRYTIDPIGNGELPIWIANYALAEYGTGIVKCSAHDERDFAFAKKYGIPLKEVLEPVLQQDSGSSAFRKNEPVQDNTGVIALVKHWKENKYLGLRWAMAPDWGTLLTGGIEDGDTPEETVLKELREETGFVNAKIVRSLGNINSKYYHVPKKLNRQTKAPSFYVELVDGEQVPVEEDEKMKHELLWLSEEELQNFLTPVSHQYLYRKFFKGECWNDMEHSILNEPDEFKGRIASEAREDIMAYAEKHQLARRAITYRLRDWVFSRQRYWGEPIPILYCENDGIVPVPYEDLPVRLPEVEHYEPTGTGESPLAAITDWVNTTCPKCGGAAKRETNTMPQWAGSSWYYLRFMDPNNNNEPVSKAEEKYWGPVDVYVGGDHAVRHLIYARFWHKFLYDIGVVSTEEPFPRLEFLGFVLAEDGRKMSKRFGNVVNPDDVVAEYGADSFRVYEMFMGPFENTIAWNTKSLVGTRRFLDRAYKMSGQVVPEDVPQLNSIIHTTIKKVGDDISTFRFNTAISAMMICLNAIDDAGSIGKEQWKLFLKLLAPFAPHLAEELWEQTGEKGSIHLSTWPGYDESLLVRDTVVIGVQVSGKTREEVEIAPDATEAEAVEAALALPKIAAAFSGGKPGKVIYKPGKILNLLP